MSEQDQLKQAWQAQPGALPFRSGENLRAQATAFQRQVAHRNLREYFAGIFVIPVFCYYVWLFPYWLTRLGAALVVAGNIVVLWQLHRRAASRVVPAQLGAACLQFQRDELERQRDALRSVWLWYLGPLMPGLVIFVWGLQNGSIHPFALLVEGVMLATFVTIAWINRRAAAKIQRRIDALDTLSEQGTFASAA